MADERRAFDHSSNVELPALQDLAELLGGTLVVSGTEPNIKRTLLLPGPDPDREYVQTRWHSAHFEEDGLPCYVLTHINDEPIGEYLARVRAARGAADGR